MSIGLFFTIDVAARPCSGGACMGPAIASIGLGFITIGVGSLVIAIWSATDVWKAGVAKSKLSRILSSLTRFIVVNLKLFALPILVLFLIVQIFKR